jgi:hypothetical protein
VAFVLLKAGRPQPKSAKQAEIRLADLLKILWIRALRGAKVPRKNLRAHAGVVLRGISAGYG